MCTKVDKSQKHQCRESSGEQGALCSMTRTLATHHVSGRESAVNLSANFRGTSHSRGNQWERAISSATRVLIIQSPLGLMGSETGVGYGGRGNRTKSLARPTGKEGLRRHSGSGYPPTSWIPQVGFGPILQRHFFACWAP